MNFGNGSLKPAAAIFLLGAGVSGSLQGQWATAGTSITSPQGSKVGIGYGTGTPSFTLDVEGNSRVLTTGYLGVTFENLPFPNQGSLLFSSNRTGYTFVVGNKLLSDGSVLPILTLMDYGAVGIGASSPAYPLDVAGMIRNSTGPDPSPFTRSRIWVYGGTAVDTTNWGYFGYGSDAVMRVVYGKTGGSPQMAFGTSSAADNTGAFSETVRINSAGNVGIGVVNPQAKLAVAGTIKASEVLVTSAPGADYVFEPGYRLRPLSEVAEYVKANGHLPEIPSAGKMKESGVNLAEMQAKLLSKIEELTLHMIAGEQRDAASQKRARMIESENRELRKRIASLEAVSRPGKR